VTGHGESESSWKVVLLSVFPLVSDSHQFLLLPVIVQESCSMFVPLLIGEARTLSVAFRMVRKGRHLTSSFFENFQLSSV
jgi:hypothetical protein